MESQTPAIGNPKAQHGIIRTLNLIVQSLSFVRPDELFTRQRWTSADSTQFAGSQVFQNAGNIGESAIASRAKVLVKAAPGNLHACCVQESWR